MSNTNILLVVGLATISGCGDSTSEEPITDYFSCKTAYPLDPRCGSSSSPMKTEEKEEQPRVCGYYNNPHDYCNQRAKGPDGCPPGYVEVVKADYSSERDVCVTDL